MKSRNTVMQLAIVAAFAGASSMAQAATTLTLPTAASIVAQEYPTTPQTLSGAAVSNIASKSTSFTPSSGQTLQVTVGLSGGATFKSNPVLLCRSTGTTTARGIVTGTRNYGGAGLSTAIFSIGTHTTAISIQHCTATVTGVTTVTGAHSTINASLTYNYGTIATLNKSGPYISFGKGASASIAAGTDQVAQVSGGFVVFANGKSNLTAGVVSYKAKNNASSALTIGGAAYTPVSINLSTASLTVQGAALSAVTAKYGVYLVTAGVAPCATNKAAATGSVANNSITFNGLPPTEVSAGLRVCVQFNGKTAIPAGSITANWTMTPNTHYTADGSMASNTLVNITHNGTTLVAPLVQTPSGYLSRLVLTNTGPAAGYTVTATSETGNTATLSGAAASGTIAANSTTVIDLPTLVTYTSGQPSRTSLTVNVAGLTTNVKGLYQIVAPDGSLSNYVMVSQ